MLMSDNKPLVYLLEFSLLWPNQLWEGEKKPLPVTQQGTEINVLSPGLLVSLFHDQSLEQPETDSISVATVLSHCPVFTHRSEQVWLWVVEPMGWLNPVSTTSTALRQGWEFRGGGGYHLPEAWLPAVPHTILKSAGAVRCHAGGRSRYPLNQSKWCKATGGRINRERARSSGDKGQNTCLLVYICKVLGSIPSAGKRTRLGGIVMEWSDSSFPKVYK